MGFSGGTALRASCVATEVAPQGGRGKLIQQAAKHVVLGRISGLFGVKGWVKVFSHTEPREAVLSYDHWLLRRENEWQSVQVAEGQRHSKTVIVRFAGCNDRDQAAELLGCDIAVERAELPEPEQGHYYFGDLEGMKVVDKSGTALGTVAYVMETGANDVLVTEGERERLIPFIANEIVLDVDLDKGVISVDWEWD